MVQIVLIIIYCLIAAVILFGLTFNTELKNERRKRKAPKLIVIDGGKAKLRRRA